MKFLKIKRYIFKRLINKQDIVYVHNLIPKKNRNETKYNNPVFFVTMKGKRQKKTYEVKRIQIEILINKQDIVFVHNSIPKKKN